MASPLDGFKLPSQGSLPGSHLSGYTSPFASLDMGGLGKQVSQRQAASTKKPSNTANIKFASGHVLTLGQKDVLKQWDQLDTAKKNQFISLLQKNGDADSQKVHKWLQDNGRLKGNFNDFSAGAADKLGGGVGRGILRGIDQVLPGHNTLGLEGLANQWDKQAATNNPTFASAYKTGATVGSVAKGIADVGTLVVPGSATEHALQGTKLIQSLNQGGKIAKGVSFLTRTVPGSLEATGISELQQAGQGNHPDLGKSALTGLGVDLATGGLGQGFRAGRQSVKEAKVKSVVGKAAQNLLDKVGSAKDLGDLYQNAIEARSTGARSLTKDEKNVIALVKNQKLNFGGDVNDAFKSLATGDTNVLRHAFDTRSGADKFVSGLFDHLAKGGYNQLKYSDVGQQLRRAIGDKMAPVYDAIDRADASFSEKQLLKEVVDYGSGNVKRGVAAGELLDNEHVNSLTDGLNKKGFQNRKLYDDVSQYVTARHENTLMDNGVKEENAAIRAKNDAVINKYTPEQQKLLEGKYTNLKDVNASWLGKMRDEGLISHDQHAELYNNPDYIRVQRHLASDAPEPISKGSGGMTMTDPGLIQKTGKSRAEMVDPLAVMQQRAHEIGQRIDKNRAAQGVLPELEGLGVGSRLPDTQAVSEAAKYKQNVAGFLDEGMPKRWELPTNVAEAVKNQHMESLGKLEQLLGKPTHLFKTLTTGINPAFGGPNIVRDVQDAGIYANGDAKFLKSLGSSLSDSLAQAFGGKTSKEFQAYMKHEGNSTFINLQSKKGLKDARKDILKSARDASGNKVKIITSNFLGSPTRGLETFANMSEQYTRFASYKAAKDLYIKQGLSDAAATRKAVLAARNNSIDFYKGGTQTSKLNVLIPYLNPAIQGGRKFSKELRENPVTMGRQIMTKVAAPAVLATMWNLQNNDTKKIYMDIPESEKDKNFLFVIPGMDKDGRNRYSVVKIPMPQGFSSLVQPLRRTIEGAAHMNHQNFSQVAEDLLSPFTGVDLNPGRLMSQTVLGNPLLKGAAEYQSGHDFYYNQDVVPGSLQGAPAPEQFTKSTSGTAIQLGKALGLSPLKLQQLSRDILGGGAPVVLNASDQAQHKLGVDIQTGGKSNGQAMLDRFSTATGGEVERQFYNVYAPTADLKNYRQKQIYQLIDQGKYKEAQRKAHDYNQQVDKQFSGYFKQYGPYLGNKLSSGANPMDMIGNLKIDVVVSKKGKPYIKR
jgi:hypothetical protein